MADMRNRHIADEGLGSISSVVATLPAAYNLGERREKDRVEYVLCCNQTPNTAINAGLIAFPLLGAGAYTMTISTLSGSNHEWGAVVAYNATVPSGNYFWGAKRGFLSGGLISETASISTGKAFYLADTGTIKQVPQSVVTGLTFIGYTVTAITSTTSGSGRNGSCYIDLPG